MLIKSALGIGPDEAQVKVLANYAGSLPSGGADDFLKGAPRSADGLIDTIRNNVRDTVRGVVLDFRDRNFPKRLDQALDIERSVMEKIRNVLVSKRTSVSTIEQARAKVQTQIAAMDTQIEAATKAGNTQLANDLTGLRGQAMQNMGQYDQQLTILRKSEQEYASNLQTLEQRYELNAANALVLKQEHKANRQLQDLPKAAQESLERMSGIQRDVQRLEQQMAESEIATKAALDQLKGNIIPLPNMPAAPLTPAAVS